MFIREYTSSDCKQLAELFYQTVHVVNAKDYTNKQLDVWATGYVDLKEWNKLFLEHNTLVAIKNSIIVGFGDIDKSGYLDRLYVHKDYQGQGIATAICNKLEQSVKACKIVTHASITAKPFFEKRGYRVIKEQQVIREGIALSNYVMEKSNMKQNGPVLLPYE
ncbi:MAG: GNAT family N-acetyltransferase [Lachnospiraceae bacterium]|nr:GNAT family N-acetyltransferase [Lachnospiraceae bacterium]